MAASTLNITAGGASLAPQPAVPIYGTLGVVVQTTFTALVAPPTVNANRYQQTMLGVGRVVGVNLPQRAPL